MSIETICADLILLTPIAAWLLTLKGGRKDGSIVVDRTKRSN